MVEIIFKTKSEEIKLTKEETLALLGALGIFGGLITAVRTKNERLKIDVEDACEEFSFYHLGDANNVAKYCIKMMEELMVEAP